MSARNREFLRDIAVFLSSAALIFIIIVSSSGCSTPNYGGSCTVNARLLGEC